jgi:hypothetical protein
MPNPKKEVLKVTQAIPGYTYGTPEVARSPVSPADFELLKTTVLFTDEDVRYLRMAGEVLSDQIEALLDVWYNFVGSHPHLVYYFSDPQANPLPEYLGRVRQRFGQWVRDLCRAEFDQAWLDYQHEIALRHHRTKKNRTDNVNSVPHIPLRYLVAFIYPITATVRPFLAGKGHPPEEVDKMHQAWFKAVTLSVALWAHPYAKDGDW